MKIVLDTNCLLHTISSKSRFHCVLTALHHGHYKLCISNDILLEYEEILMRFYPIAIVDRFMNFIFYSTNTIIINPYYKWNLIIADPEDNKFVDCALNAGADYIVTNDKHFNVLKTLDFPPIKIIDIEIFKAIISKNY